MCKSFSVFFTKKCFSPSFSLFSPLPLFVFLSLSPFLSSSLCLFVFLSLSPFLSSSLCFFVFLSLSPFSLPLFVSLTLCLFIS